MNKKTAAKIFIVVSILFIGTLCGIYGYRLVHYYRLEHPKTETKQEQTLVSILTDPSKLAIAGDGLYQEEKSYYFKGNVVDNYVKYSGILWRVVKINEDHSIVLISDDALTSMVFGYEVEKFQDSYVYQWLNQDFYKMLRNKDQYLVDTTFCIDQIIDAEHVSCKENISSKVGMISLSEYLKAGGSKSYFNNGKSYWTTNTSSDYKVWFMNQKGLASNESIIGESYHSYGVRPMIAVKGDITLLSGNGTKENPYVFDQNSGTLLKEQTIGNFVSYSDQIWKIIEIENDGVKLALNGYVKVGDEEIQKAFSDGSNLYSIRSTKNLGYYLNSTYYQSLKNKEYLIEYDWNFSYYNEKQKYDYADESVQTVKTEVGLLQVGDLFLADFSDYALLTPTSEDEGTIFTVKEDGRLYADLVTTNLKVRPAVVLNGDLNIVNGSGTEGDPFVVGD